MHYRVKKRWGQHFLIDHMIIDQILRVLDLHLTDKVVEIGPGLGALTYPLLHQLYQLTVIEIDSQLIQFWQEKKLKSLHLLHQDALHVDYHQWGSSLRIVGNLPYNISSILLIYLLNFLSSMQDLHVMIQKEVALRVVAQPHSKAYGRFSVMLQAFCDVNYLFDVPPQAFNPPPQVQSALIKIIPKKQYFRDKIKKDNLERLLNKAFSTRRKTLFNNLKSLECGDMLRNCDIHLHDRAEDVSVEQYIQLADAMEAGCLKGP